MSNTEQVIENLEAAYWAKKVAEEAYADALEAYKATNPEPGSVDGEGIKITRTKDGTRKTFDSKKFKAVYGVAEYDRFVEEKPQAGSIRIAPLKNDEEEAF